MTGSFIDHGIDTRGRTAGEVKTTCPQCSDSRRNKKDPCLAVNINKETWFCHHCGWKDGLKANRELNGNGSVTSSTKHNSRRIEYSKAELPEWAYQYLVDERCIPEHILDRNQVSTGLEWMPQAQTKVDVIRFPYLKNGQVVNVKFRDREKNFKLVKDAQRTLYGYDDIQTDELIWVEGELDKLSIEAAGFPSCVSVPNGAADKLGFLEGCTEVIEPVKKHVLAGDNDVQGKKLESELARRLGPEKCHLVNWPEGCKDANDVLRNHGPEAVRTCIETAKPYPIRGLHEVRDIAEKVRALHAEGLTGGADPGWLSLKKYYSVRPGEWTLVTGIPSHGKSELLDAMLVNLAESEGWNFGICSPENLPLERHAAKLLEKRIRKPFPDGPTPRMGSDDVERGLKWLGEHFTFILPDEDDLTVEGVLRLARALVFRKGIRGLVLDPWNELDHSRPSGMSETEYISAALTKIRRFARTYQVHVWLVAHPTKLQKNSNGNYPVPTPYDVSGSAHWRNKADNCITVWRDISQPASREVQIHVQKVRFREVGQPGMVTLIYDLPTGRYLQRSF